MTITELLTACCAAKLSGLSHVTLVKPKGSGVRLCGRRGPIGELSCVNGKGEGVLRYRIEAVVKFIERETEKGTV